MSTRQSKLAAALVIVMGASAFAQSNQGTITGAISDPAEAVVPVAQIEVRNSATGVIYNGGTSSTGNYVIPVPTGIYEITVTVPGFKRYAQSKTTCDRCLPQGLRETAWEA
jgi:Carboxypeptidase regulatory-like domain